MVTDRPDLALPPIDDGLVWLFHGTSAENAEAIRRFGWRPPDPGAVADEVAARAGLARGQIVDENARCRYGSGLASCSTSWRQAAGYARRGPEMEYIAKRLAEELTGQEPAFAHEPVVMLLAVTWQTLRDLHPGSGRSHYLPIQGSWQALSFGERDFFGAGFEERIPGDLLHASLVGVDRVGPSCTCLDLNSFYELYDPEGPPVDSRPRCPECWVP